VVRAFGTLCDDVAMPDATPTPLATSLAQTAGLPQTATADGTSTTERPVADVIAADQHLAGNNALTKRGFGILRQKISRGNALGGHS
jgi:hypothetical protein